MKVKELRDKLAEFPDDLEVLTKKTDIGGNCGLVGCVREDEYSIFGVALSCVLITDEFGYEESDKEASKDSRVKKQCITHAANGRCKTAGGYHYEYV